MPVTNTSGLWFVGKAAMEMSAFNWFSNASVVLCSQALRMMFGLDLVSIQHKNLTLNSLSVPNGKALFENGKVLSAVS